VGIDGVKARKIGKSREKVERAGLSTRVKRRPARGMDGVKQSALLLRGQIVFQAIGWSKV